MDRLVRRTSQETEGGRRGGRGGRNERPVDPGGGLRPHPRRRPSKPNAGGAGGAGGGGRREDGAPPRATAEAPAVVRDAGR